MIELTTREPARNRPARLPAFLRSPLGLAGAALIVLAVGFCYLGPLVYHTDQVHNDLLSVNLPPSAEHPFGTDSGGYDVLGRLMEGGHVSIEIGVAVALVATVIGVLYGALSGLLGKWADVVLMRIVDIGLAIPATFVFILLSRIYTPSVLLLIILLSVFSWLYPARLIRGEVLTLRTREYVQAARGMGAGSWWITVRHLIPNSVGIIIVNVTFQIADAILVLAVLQFLGFSIPPPTPTWGTMLSDGTNYLLNGYWWQVVPPLLAIVLVVMAFNFVGEALLHSFDLRLAQR